jgi:hypothetical protein
MMNKDEKLRQLFKQQKIAEIDTLFGALDTNSYATVFRCLKRLGYLTSYSHAGKFYTLRFIPRFDRLGLWFYKDVGFSQFGTLRATAVKLIEESAGGMTHRELEELLRVRAQNTLRDLITSQMLTRDNIGGVFVYFSGDKKTAAVQLTSREKSIQDEESRLTEHIDPHITIEILVALLKSDDWHPVTVAENIRRGGGSVTSQQVDAVLRRFKIKKKTFR